MLSAPTGFGKSAVLIGAAIASSRRTILLTSTRSLADQYLNDFQDIGLVDIRGRANYACDLKPDYTCEDGKVARCPYWGTVTCPYSQAEMRVRTSSLVVTNYSKWFSTGKYNGPFAGFDQLIMDEGHCFPSGTMVDKRPIESLRVGDLVTSFNKITGEYRQNKIIRTFKRYVTKVLTVRFSNGVSLTTTSNHPVLSTGGWKKAGDLVVGSLCKYYGQKGIHFQSRREAGYTPPSNELFYLREFYNNYRSQRKVQTENTSEGLLLPGVYKSQGVQRAYRARENSPTTGGVQTTHALEQPDEQSHYSREDEDYTKNNGIDSTGTGWKRGAFLPPTTISFSLRLEDRSYSTFRNKEKWDANLLQNRCWQFGTENRGRSRRVKPPVQVETSPRSQEGNCTSWVRVESIEVYESSDSERFEQMCPGGAVYNIEVENDNTYTANGIVVHNCSPEELASAMQIMLHHKEVEETLGVAFLVGTEAESFFNWKRWAKSASEVCNEKVADAAKRIGAIDPKAAWVRHYTHMQNLQQRLLTLSSANPKDWIVDELEDGFQFDPIRPARYAELKLFCRIPRIILTSATIRPKTLYMLGLSKERFDFLEFPSDFDPSRCPTYHIPTMRNDHRQTDFSLLYLKTDQIMARRGDRKGVIHTISWKRRDEVLDCSKYSSRMLSNVRGESATAIIERFKASPPPTVLVSPSVGTGVDFANEACEYQIILKIPFQDGRSKIVKARQEADPEYGPYQAMQNLVQMVGRGMRSKTDLCETFILDDHAQWFIPRYAGFAPKSFHQFFKETSILPAPPPKL